MSSESLRWLTAALSLQSKQAGLLKAIRRKYQFLISGSRTDKGDRPSFTANNDGWKIKPLRDATDLTVAPAGAVRGNLVWCELPFRLNAKSACRLTINWTVRTSGNAVNLHIRNEETGNFRVIGAIAINGKTNVPRTDVVDFVVSDDGFTQFMLGAVHFSGPRGGAEIASITVEEIPAAAVKLSNKVSRHAEKALEMALKDNERFVKAHAKNVATRGIGAARARLMFHAHAIEKGLSRSGFRAGFGKIAVPNLAKEMNNWLAAGRDTADQFFRTAASVMQAYFQRHENVGFDISEFHSLFKPEIHKIIINADRAEGGVLAAAADRESLAITDQSNSFLDVIYGRRSVREFTNTPVRDDAIRQAVQIALQAPSVCNRQAARVHLFDDPAAIKAALDIQGGFGGYEMPPRLLLVTSELSAFLFAAERNQPFIDGGLFMMTLLLGLSQVGLGSCSLNTAMNSERENAIRKILGIPDDEVFIAFVATGHYNPAILTPQSKRIPVDEVLISHRKG